MIYSDKDIMDALDTGKFIIDPRPVRDDISPSAVDLRLHNIFTVFENEEQLEGVEVAVMVGVADTERVVQRYGKNLEIPVGSYLELKPSAFVLGYTRERLDMPMDLAARVEGKSSLARLGISIHQTAPTIHADFEGYIRLEIANTGPFTCRLRPGIRVCQLVVEELKSPAERKLQSRFQNQSPD